MVRDGVGSGWFWESRVRDGGVERERGGWEREFVLVFGVFLKVVKEKCLLI